MHAVFTHSTIFLKLFKIFKIIARSLQLCILSDTIHLGRSFLIPSFAHVRQSKTAAQLVVRAPLTVRITPPDIRAAPLAARRHSNFLDLHASVSTLSTSSTPVCVSGPLQLYSSSRCLHPSGGTCPQPLPSCMCTGGVVPSFTSRLGQPLSGLTATPRR